MKRIIRWFKQFVSGLSGNQYLKYKFKIVKELPQHPEDNVFYIEGDKNKNDFWYGQMKCPCGCNDTLTLNLIDDVKPCWSVHIIDNKISLAPSVWRTKNCKSHFWLREGLIKWV
ncbi:DUF6527 family protein [Tenacibaculum adriaticum]|nr:DUF6527 family protein [Tenacibaculum adriaticum]